MDASPVPADAPSSIPQYFQSSLPALSVKTAFVRVTPVADIHDQSTSDLITSANVTDVGKEDGHRVFVIDVQLEPATPGAQSESVQVQRRFSDFWNLRHELLYRVQAVHRSHKAPCAFCASVIESLTGAQALPRLHQRVFQPTETLRLQLQEFMSFLVHLAGETKASSTARVCKGRLIVSSLVRDFLMNDHEDSEAVPHSTGWVYTLSW